ncbi:ImmA/IrrE family metallo-endopeptidase [Salinicoccus roseus]|uniref:ImmA/IrrE family metallo-endopeptidase n=1 Tax=Salinicoccus roseus TaxID=45670 RepID=UPI002301459C|nr:ImmA/IrrE family metallo-endopeptidase [Salinicoccus roseus]
MRIEKKVNDIVERCVTDRLDLNIPHLSYMFSVHIMYNHIDSAYLSKRGIDIIALKMQDPFKMWHAFCHEAGHMFLHCTNQTNMPPAFNMKQEAEAKRFALLLMMPEKLILQHELYEAQEVANYFNVPIDMALQRIEMLIEQTRITTFN